MYVEKPEARTWKAAGIAVRAPGPWGRQVSAKPAIQVTTGFGVELSEVACENPKRKATTGPQPESAAVDRNINPENLPHKRKSNKED